MHKKIILYLGFRFFAACVLMLLALGAAAQNDVKLFKVKDNLMFITLSRRLPTEELDKFTTRYNIAGIGLHQLVQSGKADSIRAMGWTVDTSLPNIFIIQKPLQSYSDMQGKPGGKIIFTPIPTPDDWRIVGGNRVIFGYNNFKSGKGFTVSGDTVYFVLKKFRNAASVKLAGNFTNWQYGAFPMTNTDSGWSVAVKLKPGPVYYKFIVNENGWTTDPDNKNSENDGKGNENSVFYVPNKTFTLKGFDSAANVFLSGSFNNWDKSKLRLQHTADGWQISMYLEPGTYKYNYYVDGMMVADNDPTGAAAQPMQLSLGDMHVFILKGFTNAKKVMLAGDFNDWKPGEINMKKMPEGWQVSYVLGPGNYQYKFIVDGRWITDPANAQAVDDGKGNTNSYLVIGANYTFHLKGFANAKAVNLAGDFNDWSPGASPMTRSGDEWVCAVRLAKGKHLYKFLVDGKWLLDPANPDWETDEHRNDNSIIWIE